jgi:hypothetical protein
MTRHANRPDWASWSARRLVTVALAYGLSMGCVVGVTEALIDDKSLSDALENVAVTSVVWVVGAAPVLWITRWGARHPTGRWAVRGSNARPPACKAGALTN